MQLFNDEQIEFLTGQAQTKDGQKWLEIIRATIDHLYYSKGVAPEDIKSRQIAAETLERIIAWGETNENKPRANKDYL
jgi:hypothetical protein